MAPDSFGCRFSGGFARLANKTPWMIQLPLDARHAPIRAFRRDYPLFTHLGKHVKEDVPRRHRGRFAADQLQLCFPTAALLAHQSSDEDGLASRAWYLHSDALEPIFGTTLVRVNTRRCVSLPRHCEPACARRRSTRDVVRSAFTWHHGKARVGRVDYVRDGDLAAVDAILDGVPEELISRVSRILPESEGTYFKVRCGRAVWVDARVDLGDGRRASFHVKLDDALQHRCATASGRAGVLAEFGLRWYRTTQPPVWLPLRGGVPKAPGDPPPPNRQ